MAYLITNAVRKHEGTGKLHSCLWRKIPVNTCEERHENLIDAYNPE